MDISLSAVDKLENMSNETDINDLWEKLIPALEKSLNKPIYETLISSTKPFALSETTLTIAVPSELVKDWLSKHCVTLMEQESRAICAKEIKVEFMVGSPDLFTTPALDETKLASDTVKSIHTQIPFLNQRYTFEHFVIGQGNRFAHAAALAVAEAPAKAYNPLFLYGGVGLGKTHLMQAIGHRVVSSNPRAKILYITSESFMNELINSIRDDKMIPFRNKYRNIDIFMVDDVQFLAGKERTQEEFFHTFNALYEAGRQIIVSSDRPPKDIPTLEERLRSRFEWGLTADIQSPDFETRIAILKKKAELSELTVADEILSYIAGKVASNIRELEGALIRVVAFASLNSSEISTSLIDEALKDVFSRDKGAKTNFSIGAIKKATADHYNIRVEDMSAKIRTKEIANARQVAMYLAREFAGLSLPKIGEEFGGRDHTTVMHACEKIKASLKSDPETVDAVKNISEKIKSYSQ